MISRQHRFHGLGSLKSVYQNGRTVRGPLFAVRSMPNPRRDTYRAAVVVSRKVNKSAVARNRIRRRLYAALRELEEDIIRPHDIVVTVFQNSLLETPPNQLKQQLAKQLTEAGVVAKRIR